MVPFLAGEWPVRQRGFSRPDRRALGAGRPRPHPSARHAPDQMGRTRQPRPHVTPWIQILRPSRGSRIWTHRDIDGHRALCGLDVQAVGFDFVDERRARNPELERGARAVPTMMRSEERRVGKECRDRWSPSIKKKKRAGRYVIAQTWKTRRS